MGRPGEAHLGGKVEVLVERIAADGEVIAQLRASKPPRVGSRLLLEEAIEATVLGRIGVFWRLTFDGDAFELIERHGRLPLPPYIDHPAMMADEERYQTVFAREKGSVAAPTAGLHFDPPLLAELARRGIETARVTLHVGAGTFQPVRVHDLAEHRMHKERYSVPQATVDAIAACRAHREKGGRVVAVGGVPLVDKLPPFAVAKQAQRGRWFAGVGGEIVEQVQIVAGKSLQGGFVEQRRIIDQAGDEMVAILVDTQAQVMVGAAEIDGEGVQRDGAGRQRHGGRRVVVEEHLADRCVAEVAAGLQGFDEALEGQSGVCAGIREGFATALQQGIGAGVGRNRQA